MSAPRPEPLPADLIDRRVLIVLLAALGMLGALCIDAYLPSLPAIAREFHVSDAAAQQTLTVYLFAFAFMMLFHGILSDSFGRRPVILGSTAVYLLASLGAAASRDLGQLLFWRVVQGLAAGAGSVVGRAIVGDCLKGADAQRMLSAISIVFGLAPAIAPILGGWLQAAFGWRSVFLFISLFAALLLAACAWQLRETLPPEGRHRFHLPVLAANYWEVLRHRRFLLQGLAISLSFSGIMIYIGSASAFLVGMLGLGVTDFGWLFIPVIGGMTLGAATVARLSHRMTPRALINVGYAIMFAAAAGNLLYAATCTLRVPWAVVGPGVYAFGMALTNPPMTILSLETFPTLRGLASSMQGFLFMIVFAVGCGALCPLLFGSPVLLALGVAGGCTLSALLWWVSRPKIASPLPEANLAG